MVFSGIISGSVNEHDAPIIQPLVSSISRPTCAINTKSTIVLKTHIYINK